MNSFTAVLARDHPGLLINTCCPGWVMTDMGRNAGSPPKTTGKQPTGRDAFFSPALWLISELGQPRERGFQSGWGSTTLMESRASGGPILPGPIPATVALWNGRFRPLLFAPSNSRPPCFGDPRTPIAEHGATDARWELSTVLWACIQDQEKSPPFFFSMYSSVLPTSLD